MAFINQGTSSTADIVAEKIDAMDSVDFLKVRVYLYKYTPQFTRIGSSGSSLSGNTSVSTVDATKGPYSIDKFKFDLKEYYLSRFDVSRFVSSYSVSQQLADGTPNWRIVFADQVVPINDLLAAQPGSAGNPDSVRRPVYFPDVTGEYSKPQESVPSQILISLIAQSKSDAVEDFENDAKRIEIAMRLRGISDSKRRKKLLTKMEASPSLDSQIVMLTSDPLVDPAKDGILLSDLIQKYDFVSAFVYSYPLVPAQLLEKALTGQLPGVTASALESANVNKTTKPDPAFFDKEALFLNVRPQTGIEFPLYEPEWNGFVTDVSLDKTAGAFNSIRVQGGGVLTPFHTTRVIFTQGLLQQSFYSSSEIMGTTEFTGFQTLFQKLTALGITKKLVESIFQIKGDTASYFDIDEIKKRGEYDPTPDKNNFLQPIGVRQLFTIPVYLYANVMRMRRFNALVNKKQSNVEVKADAVGGGVFDTNNFDDIFETYFKFLGNGFSDYTPGTKSPMEIMGDVRRSSYLEFFETPGGRIVFRTPQYNSDVALTNGGYMLTSRDIITISSNYAETARGLLSKQQVTSAISPIGAIPPLFYFYSNGKLISQYGLIVNTAQINPNVKIVKQEPGDTTTRDKGIFQYCRFFMEYANNIKLRTGSITAAGNPLIQIGRTYYDIDNQRFGYITSTTKELTVGGAYKVTFKLEGVRDAAFKAAGTPNFKKIPELFEIVKAFGDSITENVTPAAQKQAAKQSSEGRKQVIKAVASASMSIKPATVPPPSAGIVSTAGNAAVSAVSNTMGFGIAEAAVKALLGF